MRKIDLTLVFSIDAANFLLISHGSAHDLDSVRVGRKDGRGVRFKAVAALARVNPVESRSGPRARRILLIGPRDGLYVLAEALCHNAALRSGGKLRGGKKIGRAHV